MGGASAWQPTACRARTGAEANAAVHRTLLVAELVICGHMPRVASADPTSTLYFPSL